MSLLVTIGIEPREVDEIRALVDSRVVSYPGIPSIYALDGKLFVESANVMGRYLEASGVVYHGYFEGPEAEQARRAIALSGVPSFPDVRATILHDDRIHSLLLAQQVDPVDRKLDLPRGYLPQNSFVGHDVDWPDFEGERVAKWGNRHAGEGKKRIQRFNTIPESALVEPFVTGISERILLVGDDYFWHLSYRSLDWRKNVNATVTIEVPDITLVERARTIARGLRLSVLGVDFITDPVEVRSYLLEVNAYPGFEDVPEAARIFTHEAISWWNRKSRE